MPRGFCAWLWRYGFDSRSDVRYKLISAGKCHYITQPPAGGFNRCILEYRTAAHGLTDDAPAGELMSAVVVTWILDFVHKTMRFEKMLLELGVPCTRGPLDFVHPCPNEVTPLAVRPNNNSKMSWNFISNWAGLDLRAPPISTTVFMPVCCGMYLLASMWWTRGINHVWLHGAAKWHSPSESEKLSGNLNGNRLMVWQTGQENEERARKTDCILYKWSIPVMMTYEPLPTIRRSSR